MRHVATSAIGTYGAYVGYGLLHGALRHPHHGPESTQRLPGDERIAGPDSAKTFAIDIAVPPVAVWPYLVQMGFGRAGWYGWYPYENGGRGSADTVLEEFQELALGDLVPDGPRAAEGFGVWRVVELDAPSTMVLFSRRVATTGREIAADEPVDEPTIECSWAFVLRPEGAGTRLIVRVRVRFLAMNGGIVGSLTRRFFDVGDTVMEWTMLEGIKARAERIATMPPMAATSVEVRIPTARGEIFGSLVTPKRARGLVLFVHDGGTRHRLRNLRVAWTLQARGLATLVLDLHTSATMSTRGQLAYDVEPLAERIVAATDWIQNVVPIAGLPLGYVAAGAGAAAALLAATRRPSIVRAMVAYSGRLDLAGSPAEPMRSPTLLVVGAQDEIGLAINRAAFSSLPTGSKLISVDGASHLYEEPGALERISALAADWFLAHLADDGGADGDHVHRRAAD